MERIVEFIFNHYIYVLALAAVTYLLIQEFMDAAFKKFGEISPMMAVAQMNNAELTVIDVREPSDYIKGHIENAISKPLGSLEDQLPSLDKYKKKPILVVCQNGSRSVSASKTFTKAGFENVSLLTGGMQAWQDEYKLPIKTSNKYKSNS